MNDDIGQLSTSPTASENFLANTFDPVTEDLRLDRSGVFWQAVSTAHGMGRVGASKRIAILDSGFDTNIKRLSRVAAAESIIRPETVERRGRHGSAVALLANEVAPEAELLLVDIEPTLKVRRDEVADGIKHAVAHGAHVINLSLEFSTDSPARKMGTFPPVENVDPPPDDFLGRVRDWLAHSEPYESGRCLRPCPVCDALTTIPDGTAVIAAAGNVNPLVCPACFRRGVGVGFHREVLVEFDGRVIGITSPGRGRGNHERAEIRVPEPPGFDGTSFAAPLLSGFAAITSSTGDVENLAWTRTGLIPMLSLAAKHGEDPQAVPARGIKTLHAGLLAYAETIPAAHRHWEQDLVSEPCPACALFAIEWYNALVSLLIVTGESDQAAPIARIATVLAPDSPTAYGNLGEALRRWALDGAVPLPERKQLLAEANAALRRAVHLAPSIGMYATNLANVVARSKQST